MLASDTFLPVAVRENKFMSAVIIWFIGNLVVTGIRNTGAFEIYLGRKLVWSTLGEGRMPNLNDIVTGLGIDVSR